MQTAAHVQEVGHRSDLQHGVDRHPSPRRRVQQVLNDLQVRQDVHDDGNHLETGVGGASFNHMVNLDYFNAKFNATWQFNNLLFDLKIVTFWTIQLFK